MYSKIKPSQLNDFFSHTSDKLIFYYKTISFQCSGDRLHSVICQKLHLLILSAFHFHYVANTFTEKICYEH